YNTGSEAQDLTREYMKFVSHDYVLDFNGAFNPDTTPTPTPTPGDGETTEPAPTEEPNQTTTPPVAGDETPPTTGGTGLATTGATVITILAIGLALLVVGIFLLRRHRAAQLTN